MMKLSNKAISAVVSVAVVAGTIGAAAAVNNGIIAQKATSSAAISSTTVFSTMPSSTPAILSSAVISSAAPVSSKGTVSTMADGIDAIKQATDEGVSKIKEETNKAVSKVQAATSSNVAVKHEITISGGPITFKYKTGGKILTNSGLVDDYHSGSMRVHGGKASSLHEDEKYLLLSYGGHFNTNTAEDLKQAGFKLLNAKGEEIPLAGQSFCEIKVPYTNLSDISTMYLVYKDQKITITIS